ISSWQDGKGCCCSLAVLSAVQLGAVYTEGGMIEGTTVKTGLFESVDVFKGIPYAATPRRFENPEPHPGWTGTGLLKATKFRDRCLQLTLTQTTTRGSEDCLYLNIWVPQKRKKISTNLPVMVWIYGGAFFLGSSQGANFFNNYLYDGQEIASRGKVIVVTLNYRVGSLGFLSTGDKNGPGNYGLRDQHMAIKWVKRNIAAFGGDPNNITIFGESAGGASVSFQMLSPYNVGYFKRAIMQSGVALCPWAIQKNPLYWAKQIAEKVGCSRNDTAALMNCLKITDPEAITLAWNLDVLNLRSPLVWNLPFLPVIDGDFIPDEPHKLFNNSANVDFIAGANDMDGHVFAGIDVPSINQMILGKTYPEDLYKLTQGLILGKGVKGVNTTYALYTRAWGPDPSQKTIKKTIVDLETDYLFLIPTQAALELHSQHAKFRNAKTYSYLFTQPSRMPVYPSWTGADHADDIQYVFGKPFYTPLGYRPRDRDVSGYMIAYWTNFAKTGDPSTGDSSVPTPWPPYTNQYSQYLDINSNLNRDSVKMRLRNEFVKFWTEFFPSL
uniref:Carboxylic ester hydrolase n=1 Tax=Latimeria chalumnae TaxID=7897 RepID=H3B637_LATCH